MGEVRIIKKYPNRRLYDTKESRYITLNDVRNLVIEEQPFEVIDKKTEKNITRNILFNVIAEQEEHGDSVMGPDFLAHIIRACSGTVPRIVREYLEESLRLFLDQHRKAGEALNDGAGVEPIATMTNLADENLAQWLDLQKQMLRAFQPPAPTRSAADTGGGASAPTDP